MPYFESTSRDLRSGGTFPTTRPPLSLERFSYQKSRHRSTLTSWGKPRAIGKKASWLNCLTNQRYADISWKLDEVGNKGMRMENRDIKLIEAWKERDPELKRLWEEHHEFEEQLERFNKRVYLSTAEEIERKNLQKKKLKGRDRIERILVRIRKEQAASQ